MRIKEKSYSRTANILQPDKLMVVYEMFPLLKSDSPIKRNKNYNIRF